VRKYVLQKRGIILSAPSASPARPSPRRQGEVDYLLSRVALRPPRQSATAVERGGLGMAEAVKPRPASTILLLRDAPCAERKSKSS
jgi:hypothetical protein